MAENDEAKPLSNARRIAARIADVVEEEGITSHRTVIEIMFFAIMMVCGPVGYRELMKILRSE